MVAKKSEPVLDSHIQKATVYDRQDRFVGHVWRRVGYCGVLHEGRGKRQNHAKVNLRLAIDTCEACQEVLSTQSQLAAS